MIMITIRIKIEIHRHIWPSKRPNRYASPFQPLEPRYLPHSTSSIEIEIIAQRSATGAGRIVWTCA